MGDETQDLQKRKQMLKWDRKKKRFIRDTSQENKKIKTESGRYISASYKKNIYEEWKKKYKIDDRVSDDEAENERRNPRKKGGRGKTTIFTKAYFSEACTKVHNIAVNKPINYCYLLY
ncbi:ATP-dependent RNA helicase DDX54-like [Chiloscyllium plagiosum]|uniref:ATP-dependent RNA helicase DDX54-like n=1 Tax=Chiloscyllium plagiosum TaxID=36176 RepID=UPI001CB86504|nr:ATP-dependent RNA helicase DDX54-like [Chiloscyllium plagiosum]